MERMADLLSSKIRNQFDFNTLTTIKKEREIIINAMSDAILSTDEDGRITYYNDPFARLFCLEGSWLGEDIRRVMDHTVLLDCIFSRKPVTNRWMVYDTKQTPFYGFVCCTPMVINGVFRGMITTFRSIALLTGAYTEPVDTRQSQVFDQILGNSASALSTIDLCKRLAITDQTVLLQGEPGVGKDALAKAIHQFSDRATKQFIAVNCADVATQLLEEEIFGPATPSDPNASNFGMGKLWLAHNGTIYFRQVQALPLYLQRRLVEFMKTRTLQLANWQPFAVNVRMIFSSTVALDTLVAQGKFDEELYYRISQHQIAIPALRSRTADLPVLFQQRLAFFAQQYHRTVPSVSATLLQQLSSYHWPGNLKQLDQIAEQLVCRPKAGFEQLVGSQPVVEITAPVRSIRDWEREQIAQLLNTHRSKDEIAKLLGISRATLHRKIKTYQIEKENVS